MLDRDLWLRLAGAEVGKNGQVQLDNDFVIHAKEFGFYLEKDGNPLKVHEQENYMMSCAL